MKMFVNAFNGIYLWWRQNINNFCRIQSNVFAYTTRNGLGVFVLAWIKRIGSIIKRELLFLPAPFIFSSTAGHHAKRNRGREKKNPVEYELTRFRLVHRLGEPLVYVYRTNAKYVPTERVRNIFYFPSSVQCIASPVGNEVNTIRISPYVFTKFISINVLRTTTPRTAVHRQIGSD